MRKSESERVEESFAFITDFFCIAGNPYCDTLMLIRDLGKQADEGDVAARTLLDVVYRFEKLLKLDPKNFSTPKHGG